MSAMEILVIILSVVLAVLLVLSIILTVLLIKVARQIQAVTKVAKGAADNVQNMTANISKVVAPAALFRIVKDFARKSGSKSR